jgi:outer membrane protein assembly factor BamB
VAFVLLHAPGNVSHPGLSFTTSTTTTTTPPERHVVVNNVDWPRYGFDAGRTRTFMVGRVEPPLRVGWTFEDYALLEFPPVMYRNRIYFIDDNGSAKAISRLTGRQIWHHRVGTLAAASPAIGAYEGLVFVPTLSTLGSSPGNGRMLALSMKTGRIVWSRQLPAGSESSPMVWDKTLYFGDQAGNVYSLDAATGHLNWVYHAAGAVKGGPALVNGILYFGDYSGRAYALHANTGHQLWAVSTNGTAFGFGSGNFYATPAVAFGRVYMGNTDGRVYSFAAHTGQLAWATATGAYVYSSAAVEDVPGLGPTVYLGSYDGYFYAFDARSGAVRWRHFAGGKISGSPTIVGNVIYYSNLAAKATTGLNVRTGQQVFSFPDGAFNPVIADHGAIYLVGYTKLYQLLARASRAKPARVVAVHHRTGSRRHKRQAARHKRQAARHRRRIVRHAKAARSRNSRRK